ncbi:MAG TPA: hypothetical protein ENG81_04210 [Candidatus Bathyarchaeota archaeon]|nr:hypothetical protein [Candidatus Bathyarchaeota archaeon]
MNGKFKRISWSEALKLIVENY